MIFLKSNVTIEEIQKFHKSDRSPFDKKYTYKIIDSTICNILSLKPNNELLFINSAYSRYDSASIFYFINDEKNVSEIWLSDDEKIEELMRIFAINKDLK